MLLAMDHGHAVAFDRHGRDGAPAVVLLHGLSSSRATYDRVVRSLDEHVASGSIQVVNADLRGHGDSSHAPPDRYDAASYAGDVAALIEHVDAGAVLVVGHSLGGVVACALAASHPRLVARLLLEDPPLFEGNDARRASSPVAAFFPVFVDSVRALQARHADLDEYEQLLRGTMAPDQVRSRAEALSRWDPATMEAAISGAMWRTFDPTAPLACPVTVLRADPAVGAVCSEADEAAFRVGNPQVGFVCVEGSSHRIHDEPTSSAYLYHLEAAVRPFASRPR